MILDRPFALLALLAALSSVALLMLHSFAYPLAGFLALLFGLAAGTARLVKERRHHRYEDPRQS